MANQEHLALLKQGVEPWNQWSPRDTQRVVSKRAMMQREDRGGEPVKMCHTESVLR